MTQAYKTAAFLLEFSFHLNDTNRLTQCIFRRPNPAKKISFSLTVRKTPKTDKSCFPFEVLIINPFISVWTQVDKWTEQRIRTRLHVDGPKC